MQQLLYLLKKRFKKWLVFIIFIAVLVGLVFPYYGNIYYNDISNPNQGGHYNTPSKGNTEFNLRSVSYSSTTNSHLIYGPNNTVIKNITVGSGPSGAVFDASNGNIYVMNDGSKNVSVIDGATNTVIKNITVGSDPCRGTFDSSNGYIYVTHDGSKNVSVIDGATNTVIKNITVGSDPSGAVFDPSNGYIYITNSLSNNVSVINGATNNVITSIAVGAYPYGGTFDPSNGYIYLNDRETDCVSVINGSTNQLISNIIVDPNPSGATFDPQNGYVYVTSNGHNSVSVINDKTNVMIKSISVGESPYGISFDQSNGYIYVANYCSDNVSIINATTNTVIKNTTVGLGPLRIAFDLSNGYLYVTNGLSRNVSVISPTALVISEYSVSFKESSLPLGFTWYVNVSNGMYSGPITSSNYTVYLQNGSYSFYVTSANKTFAPSYVSTCTVNGAHLTIPMTFTEIKYILTIQESGLPSGTEWNLTFEGTTYHLTNTSYIFAVPNGTYSFFATSHDYKNVYGAITVSGSSLIYTINMEFQLYAITFNQTGLQSGMFWYVNITESNGTKYLSGPITGSNYTFSLTNGSYTFTIVSANKIYAPNLTAGSFTVNGLSLSESITFSEVLYSLQFTENGLPSGVSWYVNITESNGTTYLSGPISGSSYSFSLTNGSYTYRIASSNRIYEPSILSSILTVDGSTVSIPVAFSEVLYSVQFTESGLPLGTPWYVNITESNGTIYLSGPIGSGSIYTIKLTNGTYVYSISTSNRIYAPVSSQNSLVVNGSSLQIGIKIIEVKYNIEFKETGLPSGVSWYVNITESNDTLYLSGPISGSSYSFSLTNGSYKYTIASSNKIYAPTLISATFTVDGSTIAIPTTFTLVKYNLTIQESGLPTNTEWNLTFEGTTYQLTNYSKVIPKYELF